MKPDSLILTTSKDSTMKVFHTNSVLISAEYNFKLDRSKNESKFLFQINDLYFGTYSEDSPLVQLIEKTKKFFYKLIF